MAAVAPEPTGAVLNSWKEIANHLGRGVRTVQRWEHDLGLPVRRPWGRSRSTVVALSDELDAWLLSAPKLEREQLSLPAPALATLRQSIRDAHELCSQARRLRTEYAGALDTLMRNVTATLAGLQAEPVRHS